MKFLLKVKKKEKPRLRSVSVDRKSNFCHQSNNLSHYTVAWTSKDDDNLKITQTGESKEKSTKQLYYTTPPRVNMVPSLDGEKRLDNNSGFSRLARRLSQKEKTDFNRGQLRQRSVSVDLSNGQYQPVNTPGDLNLLNKPNQMAMSFTSPLYPQGRLTRSFSTTPRKKTGAVDTSNMTVATVVKRGKGEKKSPHDITALFDAVEQQDLDQVKFILENNSLDLNSVNCENLSPLDIAVMTNNIPMAKYLLSHGAKENPFFQQPEYCAQMLDTLVADAESKVVNLMAAVLNGSSAGNNVSSLHQKENEKQLAHWEFRHKLLKRMRTGYCLARSPDCPSNVTLSVSSSSSLLVHFDEPLNHNGAVVTSYKVEWSKSSDFLTLEGESTMEELNNLQYEITNLDKDSLYYVQVCARNMKGYGAYSPTNPSCAQPSSWHDVNGIMPRSKGKLNALEDLFSQVRQSRPVDAPAIKEPSGESPVQRKRKSLKNLFSLSPKFQKSLQRGVYLSCLLHHKDKILITQEDQLPVVEVDENFSSTSIHSDFYWLMKIACTWTDVKPLRQDMYKSTSAGSTHFRGKLLQAAALLQSALGLNDLGQLYHKPLRDTNGSIVLVCIKEITDPKFLALGSGKWVSQAKLQRRIPVTDQEHSEAHDLLLNTAAEMILYNERSTAPVQRGLYLGYLKMVSSVELINVLTPHNAPNVFPHVRIRDCPNVSKDEWQWLQNFGHCDTTSLFPTPTQRDFHHMLNKAIRQLIDLIGLTCEFDNHRLYDVEVIEMSKDVSFFLLLPPVEDVCIVPGRETDPFTKHNDLCALPVQVFEINHMTTYQPELISLYSRLSSILENDLELAQQAQREAFSSPELVAAKERVDMLTHLQAEVEKTWKGNRWISDIIAFARDKTKRDAGIPLKSLLSYSCGSHSLGSTDCAHNLFHNNSSLLNNASLLCDSNLISVGKDKRKLAKFYDPMEHNKNNNNQENILLQQASGKTDIVRVYAMYETGLAKGMSVRLCVTQNTTAREVINLVIQELNKEVQNKNLDGPIYSQKQFNSFCLVVCVGTREKLLQDESRLMSLQGLWRKGRFYVQMKADVLPAAIEKAQATAV